MGQVLTLLQEILDLIRLPYSMNTNDLSNCASWWFSFPSDALSSINQKMFYRDISLVEHAHLLTPSKVIFNPYKKIKM